MEEYNYFKKIIKVLVLITIFLILMLLIYYFTITENLFVLTIIPLFAAPLIPEICKSFINLSDNNNWKTTQRKLERVNLINKDTIIRISFAYLYRIKVDGKYFLVLNNRTGKYQPVGGAYKFYNEEAKYLARYFSIENDDRIPIDEITKKDYRLLVKNRYLRKFIRRFDKTPYRESYENLSREFIEEIFKENILNKEIFGELSYIYAGRHITGIEYGQVFNHYELLLADIIKVQLTEKQEDLFRELMSKDSNKYIFATPDEIKSYGVKYNTQKFNDNIANHTPKILSENTDKLIKKNENKETISINLGYAK